jgi:hypothetical protein
VNGSGSAGRGCAHQRTCATAFGEAVPEAKRLAFRRDQTHNLNANDSHFYSWENRIVGLTPAEQPFLEDGMDDHLTYQTPLAPRNASKQNAHLVASLLHLMSHYSARSEREEPCIKLAAVIERHLTALSRLPGVDPVLRASCEQLSETWGDLVDVRLPVPTKRNIFARFMNLDRKRNARCSGVA